MLNVLTAKTDMSSSLFKLMKMGIFFFGQICTKSTFFITKVWGLSLHTQIEIKIELDISLALLSSNDNSFFFFKYYGIIQILRYFHAAFTLQL